MKNGSLQISKIDNHKIAYYNNNENFIIYWEFANGYLQQTLYYNILTDRLTYTNHNITNRQRKILVSKIKKFYNQIDA